MVRNFNFYLLPSIIRGVFGILIIVPLTTYYLDPKDFGIIAIITALTTPIGPLASSGCAWVLGGNYFKLDDHSRRILLFNLLFVDFILKTTWVFIFWVGAKWILAFVITDYKPEYSVYFSFSLLGVWLGTFSPTVSQLIILQEKAVFHAGIEMLKWIARVVTIIFCLACFNMGLKTLIIAPIVENAVSLFVEIFVIYKNSKIQISRQWITEVVKVGLPSIPSNLSETIGKIADRYFIKTWLSLASLGIYSHSQTYMNMFKLFIKAFQKTIFPDAVLSFSKESSVDSERLKRILTIFLWVIVLVGIMLILFSYEAVDALTHGKFVAAAPLIPLWFLIVFSQIYGMLYGNYLITNKKNRFLMISMSTTSIFFIGITALCVYFLGLYGATVSIVASNFTVQLWGRIVSAGMGCPVSFELHFWMGLALYIMIYLINWMIDIPLSLKVIFSMLIILGAFYIFKYRLSPVIRDSKVKYATTN
jgi:O-antigen/teichoic acid export membrane protein